MSGAVLASMLPSAARHDQTCCSTCRLMLTGQFADHYVGMNSVFVGPYPCDVIMHLSSDTVVRLAASSNASIDLVRPLLFQHHAACMLHPA